MRVRALLCLALLSACGPKVAPKVAFDEELPKDRSIEKTEGSDTIANVEPARPEAPPAKGVRTGIIDRARLIAVLDGGPGMFLRQLEVTPRLQGQKFVGWQLVQVLDKKGPLVTVDVEPGDVLLAVNGKPLSRPDQLQTIWDSLRTANELRAQLWRGDAKLELAFAIEPKIDPASVQAPPPPPPPSAPSPPTESTPEKTVRPSKTPPTESTPANTVRSSKTP